MLRARRPVTTGLSSSTGTLFNRVAEALGTSSGMQAALNGLFGSSRVIFDEAFGCWLIPSARAQGETLVVGSDGRTIEIKRVS
jgi:hypothetical protein